MLNITILSLAIAGSFQKSPFIQVSSSNTPCFSIFKKINTNHFFSSFLITHAFNSFSIVKESTFDHFITSQSILSFSPTIEGTTVENSNFYGDTIPSNDKNKFCDGIFTRIINCKFMSITDDVHEQLKSDVGLCIFSKKNTTVDHCYFFAILSYRSGSAIIFTQEDQQIVHSNVTNSVFKSITQDISELGNYFITGGAVSYGRARILGSHLYNENIQLSKTENCCFDKVCLTGEEFNARQFGILTYLSNEIRATNINFTNNEMNGFSQRYGNICILLSKISTNHFSFINFYNSEFTQYGIFSIVLFSQMNQQLFLSFSNFINNSNVEMDLNPLFGIDCQQLNETQIILSNIQCNYKLHFFGFPLLLHINDYKPIKIKLSNSIFKSSFSDLCQNNSYFSIILDEPNSNLFLHNKFDVYVVNNIISSFGYVQTSFFSNSNSFSDIFIHESHSYDDLEGNAILAGTIATIIGVISFIAFMILLCLRRASRKRVYEQIGCLDSDIESERIDDEQILNENINVKEGSNDNDKSVIDEDSTTDIEINNKIEEDKLSIDEESATAMEISNKKEEDKSSIDEIDNSADII